MNVFAGLSTWYQLWLRCLLTGEPTPEQFMTQCIGSIMQSSGLDPHASLYGVRDGKLVQVYPLLEDAAPPIASPEKPKRTSLRLVVDNEQ